MIQNLIPREKIKSGKKATVHRHVYDSLKLALMNGDFVPGQRLVVRVISEQFKISAMPVREALRQLVSEQALFDHSNRGVIVPNTTAAVIADVVRVRCSTEGSAAEWAASTITEEEFEYVIELNEKMKECVIKRQTENYLFLNRTFHFTVYKAARSSTLQDIIERLWLRAGPWLNIMRDEAALGIGLVHHDEIIEGLRKGDGALTKRAVVADISDAAHVMLRAASHARVDGSEILSVRPAAKSKRKHMLMGAR